MLDLDALIRNYARHLQDESMLAQLTKEDDIIKRPSTIFGVLVNEPLQPRQTSEGDNLKRAQC